MEEFLVINSFCSASVEKKRRDAPFNNEIIITGNLIVIITLSDRIKIIKKMTTVTDTTPQDNMMLIEQQKGVWKRRWERRA